VLLGDLLELFIEAVPYAGLDVMPSTTGIYGVGLGAGFSSGSNFRSVNCGAVDPPHPNPAEGLCQADARERNTAYSSS